MIFILDESAPRLIADHLRQRGHEVVRIVDVDMGAPDEAVLERANTRDAILVTCDKDFGRMVFAEGRLATGVLFVRLAGLAHETKAELVAAVVDEHGAALLGAFTVVSPGLTRLRRLEWRENG